MQKFTNPLDKIKIAAPCAANWDEMFGDERRRFCSACKLNVYNLSEMTREEAENFLINSEGRVCLRIFRRADGSVITQNCPVGWQALKRKASRAASAALAMMITIFSGILGFRLFEALNEKAPPKIYQPDYESGPKIIFGGITSNLPEIKLEILRNRRHRD
ncbi:MAG TPA: hypothetical protein VF599_18050 [Pyrinomonadaceae bacterium]|jgi:hypothetical protein